MSSQSCHLLAVACLLGVLLTAASGNLRIPPRCQETQSLDQRENAADIVFSGRIAKIEPRRNASYSCLVQIYRVMKGKELMSDILDLALTTRHFYRNIVKVGGFGSPKILCNSQHLTEGDIRIFLVGADSEGKLSLNSSLIRIGLRTLGRAYLQTGKFFSPHMAKLLG